MASFEVSAILCRVQGQYRDGGTFDSESRQRWPCLSFAKYREEQACDRSFLRHFQGQCLPAPVLTPNSTEQKLEPFVGFLLIMAPMDSPHRRDPRRAQHTCRGRRRSQTPSHCRGLLEGVWGRPWAACRWDLAGKDQATWEGMQ